MMEFEYLENDKIGYIEDPTQEEQQISHDIYKIFVDEKFASKNNNIRIIPQKYYNFLRSSKNVGDGKYTDQSWDVQVKPHLPEKTNDCLFDFQRRAILNMIRTKRCLNASSMGIGKSIQSLCAMSALRTGRKGDLILCPAYIRMNWMNEINKWLPNLSDQTIIIRQAGKKDIDNATHQLINHKGIIIISYDTAAKIFSNFKKGALNTAYFNTVICDESHFLKERTTQRFKHLQKPITACENVLILSGTPMPNRPRELYTQFALLYPKVFNDHRTFAYRYCDGQFDNFGRFDDRGMSKTRELAVLMKKIIIRLRREDVMSDLPSVSRQKVVLDAKPSQKFKSLMKRFHDQLGKVEEDRHASFQLQALTSEMFRETSKIKKQPVLDFVGNFILQNEDKVILFFKHLELQSSVSSFLTSQNQKHITISGSVSTKKRPQMIKTFLDSNEFKYALLTIDSCCTGINLVPVPKMIFCELTWSVSDLCQAECRINRVGAFPHLEYTYLVCANSLDEKVFKKLENKANMTNLLVDDGNKYDDFIFSKKRTNDQTSNQPNKKNKV
jgi:SNF2 family DNA or RNA helicase